MEFGKYFKPMLLSEIDKPFDSPDYLFELKFDGIRAIIHVSPKKIKIFSRRGLDITELYPELKDIKKIVKDKMIFDGEIVMFKNGKPNFSKLQERNHLKNKIKIKKLAEEMPVCFIVFDCLYKNKDITNKKILERKNILNEIEDNDLFIKTKYIINDGKTLFKKVKKMNFEGIIAKKINSTYQINTRSDDWIKIKNLKIEKLLIGGYYDDPNHSMIKVYLGEYVNNIFYYLGKVMIGKKTAIYKKILKEKVITKSPFNDYEDKKMVYLEPKIYCKIAYLERTMNNHLRQPIYIK